MKASEAFPSNYLKAADLGEHRPIVTIDKITMEELGIGDQKDTKPVIWFQGKEKGLVCNVTNWRTCADLYGNETDDWIGQKIQLYAAPVDFKGKTTMAIRILPKKPLAVAPGAKSGVSGKAATPQNDVPVTSGEPLGSDLEDEDIQF